MSEHEPRREASDSGPRLTRSEADRLAEQLAELTAAQIPLAEGLRAAAEEAGSYRLRRAFDTLASRLEAGQPLEEGLLDGGVRLPPHVTGLVAAGLRSGQLSQVLTELVERQRTLRELRLNIRLACAYPLFLITAMGVLFAFIFVIVMPALRDMIEEFDLELPVMTRAVFAVTQQVQVVMAWLAGMWASLSSVPGLVTAAVLGAGLAALFLWFRRRPEYQRLRAAWHWALSTMPILGSIRTGIVVADFARLLRVLLEQQIPLPDALRLTAAGMADAHVAEVSRHLARGTDAGRPLSDLLAGTPRMPALLVPLVRWGERAGRLPEALDTISEMYEVQARLGSAMLVSVLPPLAFVLVGASLLGLLTTITLPLIGLIQNLS